MSKLFANVLMEEQKVDLEALREVITNLGVKARYTKYNKSFHFTCLNMFFYIKSEGKEIEKEDFVVYEPDLTKMINFDVLLTEDSKKDLSSDSRFIKDVEKNNTELAINYYWNISFIQRFFTLTKNTLKEIKKKRHLWKLGREKSPYYALSAIPANRHGGRPFGSKTKLSDEEHERLLDNLSRYDVIVKKYVEKGIMERFVDMHKDLHKLPKNELPELLRRPFMDATKGIEYYYFALRYEYKREIGIPDIKINPGAEDIFEKSKKYKFPFKYTGLNLDELIDTYDNWTRKCVRDDNKETFVNYHKKISVKNDLPRYLAFTKRGNNVIELLWDIMCCDFYGIALDNKDAVRVLYYQCTANNPIFKKYSHLIPERYVEYKKRHEKKSEN